MSTSPETMRRPVLTAPRRIELRTVTRPSPGRGQVLIRNVVNGVCGSEFAAYLGVATVHPMHLRIAEYPVDLTGHESAGVVEQLGPGVRGFSVGDPVVGEVWKGYSEYCVARTRRLLKFPPELPFEKAAMTTMVGETAHAVSQVARQSNHGAALVIGLGAAGLLTAQHLRRSGWTDLTGIDPVDARARIARDLGVESRTDPTELPGQHYSLIVETSGTLGGTELAMFCAAGAASIGLFGRPSESQKVLLEEIFHRRLRLIALRSPAPAYGSRLRKAALKMIRTGEIRLDPLIGPIHPLDEIREAFEDAAVRKVAPRVFVRLSDA